MEKKSVMEKKMGSYGIHIIIVGIVAIVAIVAIVGMFRGMSNRGVSSSGLSLPGGDLAGQAIGDWCTDSDGGMDISIRGHTIGFNPQADPSYPNVDVWDVCAKDSSDPFVSIKEEFKNNIFEYGCRDGYFYSEMHTCPNGCSDGACIDAAPLPVAECTDPDCADPSLEIYTKGISTQPDGTTLTDTCAYDQLSAGQIMTTDIISCYPPNCKLKERKCPSSSSSLVTTEEVGCQYGCSDGACRSTADPNAPKCSATDGKGNKFVKGVCVDGVTGEVKEDSCKRNNLRQTYCTGIGTCGVDEMGYECPHGCGNGVCKGALK